MRENYSNQLAIVGNSVISAIFLTDFNSIPCNNKTERGLDGISFTFLPTSMSYQPSKFDDFIVAYAIICGPLGAQIWFIVWLKENKIAVYVVYYYSFSD